MKMLSKNQALRKLELLKQEFREAVSPFEQRAKDCLTCEEQGVCCTDAHFVNVHVTRLEAEAMNNAIEELPDSLKAKVRCRIEAAVREFDLKADDHSFERTYSCPLFEPGIGCLVHSGPKPLPCIHHACYERVSDLPPDEILESGEAKIERLNSRAFGNAWNWMPIPVALLTGCRGTAEND